MKSKNKAVLLVANWDSATGYAWWLIEGFWLQLARYYSGKQMDAHLVYPGISTVPENIATSNIAIHQLDFRKSDFASLLKQCNFIRKHKITTIYYSDYPDCSYKYLVYRLLGVKYIIIHDHAPGVRDQPGKLKGVIKKLVHRIPLICASGLIGASEYVRKRHISVNCMPADKCFSAPNGLPGASDVKAVDISSKYAIPGHRKVMVTTGRANRYKGIDFALAVVESLVNEYQREDIHYLFCGDGPDMAFFKAMAKKLDIEEYVTFAGKLGDVFPYLLACDFAIHPSKGEVGYSLSILEYMQAGLPVVVPDNPSVSGATIDKVNGCIYRENDVLDAAKKINWLLSDDDLPGRMGVKAKQHVLDNYNLDMTHERLLQAVSKITSA